MTELEVGQEGEMGVAKMATSPHFAANRGSNLGCRIGRLCGFALVRGPAVFMIGGWF
ncbi:hypothetical protein [Rosistilla oblonga]|uniref:hypothetical protein n=1 Tax=Rosistilla oblonga TaxID=2527990 RepID=UPI003A97F43C